MENEYSNSLSGLDPKKSIERKVLPKVPPSLQADAKAGKLATREVKYFMRLLVTGTMVEYDFTSVAKTKGVTNLDNAAVPQNSHGIIKRIEVRYYTGADCTVLASKYAPLASTLDPALMNGELEVKVADEVICLNPMNNFQHSPSERDQAADLANGFNLNNHEPYRGGDIIKAVLRCGSTLQSSNPAAMEVAIICEEVIKNRSL